MLSSSQGNVRHLVICGSPLSGDIRVYTRSSAVTRVNVYTMVCCVMDAQTVLGQILLMRDTAPMEVSAYAFCMVFHVRWIFLTTSRLRRGWDSETSGETSISHRKSYEMHFLAYFALQGTLVMLKTM